MLMLVLEGIVTMLFVMIGIGVMMMGRSVMVVLMMVLMGMVLRVSPGRVVSVIH